MGKQESCCTAANSTLVGGLLLSTVLGAGAAYLLSNSGKSLRNKLTQICSEVSEQAQGLADEVARRTGNSSSDFSGRFFKEAPRSQENITWIIGGIAVSVLGISALVLCNRHSEPKDPRDKLLNNIQCFTKKSHVLANNIEEAAHDVAESFEDRVTTWVETAQRFIDSVDGCAKKVCESSRGRAVEEESTLDKVVDWAAFGLRLYQAINQTIKK